MRHQKFSQAQNGVGVLFALRDILHLPITTEAIEGVQFAPDYPSMLCLANALRHWKIKTLGIKITPDRLPDVPLPAIAHVTSDGGLFVLITKLEGQFVNFIHPGMGPFTERLSEFCKKWDGVLLLVEAGKNAGEEHYNEKRKAEIRNIAIVIFLAAVLLGGLLGTFALISPLPAGVLSIKLFGLLLCSSLLARQFGRNLPVVSNLCKAGAKSSCDFVLNSPASKILGIIGLVEIGTAYYIGSALFLAVSAVVEPGPALSLQYLITLALLPFTIFSVCYQGLVLKRWCPVCLLVVLAVWTEFSLLALLSPGITVSPAVVIQASVCFSIPLLFWLAIRDRFAKSYQLPILTRQLSLFKRSQPIFRAMLEGSSKVNSGALTTELSAGDSDSALQITFVSSPTCKPCISAHKVIRELSREYPGYINVKYRFSFNKDDVDSLSYKVIRKVLAIMLGSTQHEALDALSSWLNIKYATFENWEASYKSAISASDAKVNQLMLEHIEWCKQASISATPTLFINDHKVPEEYSVEDVRYHISNWLVPADVISHGSVSENEKEIAPGVACPPL
jgi:uncharacterized membrane protein